MRDFVHLEPYQIRDLLSHGAFLTVDYRARDAYLHGGEVTAPVDTDLVEALLSDGFIRQVNPDDPTIDLAIYSH
ncbi:MAG: hypothetical protein WD273_03855 [Trueperaceae bacterium]